MGKYLKEHNAHCHISERFRREHNLFDSRSLLEQELERNEIVVLFGGRNSAKSTGVADYTFHNVIDKGFKFIYIVRNAMLVNKAQGYFRQVDDRIELVGNVFYLDDEEIGLVVPLTLEEQYKSGYDFSDYNFLIFEEFTIIDPYGYVDNEIYHLRSLISTVTRFKQDVKLVMVGNNNTRMNCYNPHFSAMGIDWDKVRPEAGKMYRFGGYKNGKLYSRKLLVYVDNGYKMWNEIPLILREENNEVATSGGFNKENDIIYDMPTFKRKMVKEQFRVGECAYLRFYEYRDYIGIEVGDYMLPYISCYDINTPKGYREFDAVNNKILHVHKETFKPIRYKDEKSKYNYIISTKDLLNVLG